MKKLYVIVVLFILAAVLTACTGGAATAVNQAVNSASSSSSATVVSTAPASSADALAENEEVDTSPSDYTWDDANAAAITLDGESIRTDATGVTVDGSTAIITRAGAYLLSGSLTDGQIIVDTQDDAIVQLILNGVDLVSSSSAPIYIRNAEKAVLLLAEGSSNTVSDASTYVYASAEEDEPNAAIFSTADLSIGGRGTLTVTGNANDGIASKDGLVIASGTIFVTAADDGIRGKDYVVVEDGSIRVDAGGDGIKSDNEEDTARGFVSIAAGSVEIKAGGDAISAQSDVIITGGEFNLTTAGGSAARIAETLSAKGIKGIVSVVIDGGNFIIDSADDALHSNGGITVNNGTFNIASGDDGLHADATLTINGGLFDITDSYEGLESAVIIINAGDFQINASDDGINVAGGMDGSGMQGPGMRGGPGARPGGAAPDVFNYNGSYYFYLRGGTIAINAYGDGIDINGAVEMSGGTLLVSGPIEQNNAALDYDGGFTMTGGLLIAAGSSGMAMAPGANSSQNSAAVFFTSTLPAGTLVHVQNSSGEEVFTFASAKDFQSIVFSSPLLVQGQTYDVYVGGSAEGAQSGGLVEGGTYTPGDLYGSLTVSSAVTQLGSGGGFGGRGPGPVPRP